MTPDMSNIEELLRYLDIKDPRLLNIIVLFFFICVLVAEYFLKDNDIMRNAG